MIKSLPRTICGRTSGGKAIFEYPPYYWITKTHPLNKYYTPLDHYESYALFQFLGTLAMKAKRYNFYAVTNFFEQSELHGSALSPAEHEDFDKRFLIDSFLKLEDFGKSFKVRKKRLPNSSDLTIESTDNRQLRCSDSGSNLV